MKQLAEEVMRLQPSWSSLNPGDAASRFTHSAGNPPLARGTVRGNCGIDGD